MRYLITVPACLNATEHALKCITLNGINDKNERVRVAAFQMLNMLKGHRYIRVIILARLQVETSESVRREIVPVIFKVCKYLFDLLEEFTALLSVFSHSFRIVDVQTRMKECDA
ncbi:unnamed protein product [Angiostrongylus costaricensis]|uniref:Adaptin_N domain-containing protein n=1 Tax=Angiostrongylus costaricensis TaxID=334426 RepID=A0A0R3PP76_ANGCS|nr:unnamed protein product [Angiostrongylus costaricensis]